MKVVRVLVYPVLLLLALWIPKIVVAELGHGYGDISSILGYDSDTRPFWDGWFASLTLMALVHGWFLRGVEKEKYLMVWLLAAAFATLALQGAIAPSAHMLNSDNLAFDAITLLFTGFMVCFTLSTWRAIRKGRNAPKKEEGRGQWVVYVLQCLLWMAASFTIVFDLSYMFEPNHFAVVLSWIMLFPLLAVSTLLHEGGHYVGARLFGMKVLLVRVMAVECHPRRGWWLIRWAPQRNKRYGGFVYALPDPARQMRRPMMWMTAMGPMANAVACVISTLILLVVSQPLASLAIAFAVVNGVMAITNLLPRTGSVNSDGAKLLHWWRHKDDTNPELASIRLGAHSVFGTTADELVEADIQLLESRPMPLLLTAVWYRLKAAQNRADWDEVLRIGDRFEEALRSWNKTLPELDTHIRHVRTEVAFSRAMATGRHDDLQDSLLSKELRQIRPYLWLRCLALKALLDGAEQEAQRLLQKGMDEASRSVDLALPKSEAMLGRHVLERGRV